MLARETGSPRAFAQYVFASQIRHLVNRAAEAGGADHRAVRAGETALGHILPARVFEISQQQIADIGCIERPAARFAGNGGFGGAGVHPRFQIGRLFAATVDVGLGRGRPLDVFQHVRAAVGTHIDEKLVVEFCQSQIESVMHRRAGLHRMTEAGGSGATAVYRDQKQALSAGLVTGFHVRPAQKGLILYFQSVQIAATNSDDCQRGAGGYGCFGLPAGFQVDEFLYGFSRRKEIVLQRMRTDDKVKVSRRVVFAQPIMPAVLVVNHPHRKLRHRFEIVEDDGFLIQARADDAVPKSFEGVRICWRSDREMETVSPRKAWSLPCPIHQSF
jgi:hypothetical protein